MALLPQYAAGMEKTNCDILQEEMGEKQYQRKIAKKARQFHERIDSDSTDRKIQLAIHATSFAVTIIVALAFAKKEICFSTVVKIEAVLLPAAYLAHRKVQDCRNKQRQKIEKLLTAVKDNIPENRRLIGDAALQELGMDENIVPSDPYIQRGKKIALSGAQTLVEKLIPYVTALFS